MRAQLSLTPTVRFVWDPRPSSRNLLDRAFDFEFATGVFTDRTWRLVVGATRVTLGLSEGIPLVVAWV
ncbi:MAG: hypothetical protein HY275_05085 [Gemmatimonadetes bacterium]|nr:hypothetical protein [Gemmatimonadota bacterium]